MEQENTSTGGTARSFEVVRPVEGRMIAGVAKGLSNRFDIADWLVRVSFVVTAFMGIGLVAYLACWALIRDENEETAPAEQFFSRANSPQAWVGVGLIALALFILSMIIAVRLTFISPGVMWAGLILLIGALLYTGQLKIPQGRPPGAESGADDHKEGVQQVTTDTNEPADVSPVGTALLVAEKAPEEIEPLQPKTQRPPRPPKERSPLGQITIGLMLLAVAALAILNITTDQVNPTMRHYLAVATVVLGLGLLVGSIWGRARFLILIGFVLVPLLFVSPLVSSGWWSSAWTQVHQPTSFDEVLPQYSLETGAILLDLTQLPWDPDLPWDGSNRPEIYVGVDVNVGSIEVRVPLTVMIEGTADVSVGAVDIPGSRGWGIDRSFEIGPAGGSMSFGLVRLHLDVDVGSIRVVRTNVPSAG